MGTCQRSLLVLAFIGVTLSQLSAQTPPNSTNLDESASVIPRYIRFSGTATQLSPPSDSSVIGVTFSLYADQQGGSPLWVETQNVTIDAAGRYSVLLGSATKDGLPADLFVSGEARWLGVKIGDAAELSRVLLVSVPYALKAGDAETLGGKPLSAFVLAQPGATISTDSDASVASAATTRNGVSPRTITQSTGTSNYLPLFTDNFATLGNSIIYQSPSGNIGIGFTNPSSKLVVGASNGGGVLNASNLTDQDMLINLSVPGAADKNAYFGSSTPTSVVIGVGGAEKVRVSNSGNVGIGVSNPSSRLAIGAPAGGGVLNASNLADQDMQILLSAPGAGYKNVFFGSSTATNLVLGAGNQTMFLTGTNNVGIGTSTPSSKLTVAGIVQSTSGGFKFPDGSTQTTAASAGVAGVSSVSATGGSGLTASPTSGAVVLNTDTTILQKRVTGTCASGMAIQSINTDGTVTCVSVGGSTSLPSGFNVFGSSPTATLPGYAYNGNYAVINGAAWDSPFNVMPVYATTFASTQFGNNIYVFGLPDGANGPDLVYVLNTTTGAWTKLASMPIPRDSATAVVYGTNIYVFGGYDKTGTPSTSCEVYIPASNMWGDQIMPTPITCASLPTAATGMSGAAIPATSSNPGIYLFGGGNNTTPYLNQAIRYNVGTPGTYDTLTNLPTGVWYSAAAYTNNLIYVMGGIYAGHSFGGTLNQAYNPATNSFSAKSNLQDNRANVSVSVASNGDIYITGDALGTNTTFWDYNPPSDTYVKFPQLPRGRLAGGSAVLTDGRLVVFGGSTDNVVDVFHPDRVLYEFSPI